MKNIEIERKYLVTSDIYRSAPIKKHIRQGYFAASEKGAVRVRISDDKAFITIKDRTIGFSRHEFEYSIPVEDAQVMLNEMCAGKVIDKVRYCYPYEGHVWEVDEFGGSHAGLVIAEIELLSEDEKYELPPFVGAEVTGDKRYYNAWLVDHPAEKR